MNVFAGYIASIAIYVPMMIVVLMFTSITANGNMYRIIFGQIITIMTLWAILIVLIIKL
jgi:hypothetical protein